MRKLLLLVIFITANVYSQEKDTVDVLSRYAIKQFSEELQPDGTESRDYIVSLLDSIIKSTSDKEVHKLGSKKIKELNAMEFMEIRCIDINTLSRKEQREWRIKEDKFKGTVFIKDKKIHSLGREVYPYISIKNGYMYLRFVVRYTGSSWVFFDKVIFLIDGKKYEFVPSTPKTKIINTGVSEHSDTYVDKAVFNLLQKIANAKNVEYRLEGSKGVRDKKLGGLDLKGIKETLEFYERLKK